MWEALEWNTGPLLPWSTPLVTAEVNHLTAPKATLWHAYRRKWASERKHHSLVDVAAAGGWKKDRTTLLTCYQQPDEESVFAVMAEPRKRRGAGAHS